MVKILPMNPDDPLPDLEGWLAALQALGPMEFSYTREFSKYRKADVSSKITVPK